MSLSLKSLALREVAQQLVQLVCLLWVLSLLIVPMLLVIALLQLLLLVLKHTLALITTSHSLLPLLIGGRNLEGGIRRFELYLIEAYFEATNIHT